MFSVEHKFKDLLQVQLDHLINGIAQLESELIPFEHIEERDFKKLLTSNHFEKYRKLLTAMSVTSSNNYDHFRKLTAICHAALAEVKEKNKKEAITKIIKELVGANKLSLSYAEKLPFSFGDGWAAKGEISDIRKLVNIAGYLMVSPVKLIMPKKGKSMYNKSLLAITNLAREHEEALRDDNEFSSEVFNAEHELKDTLKDFKIFMRITKRIGRKYRKLGKDIKKILNNKENGLSYLEVSNTEIAKYLEYPDEDIRKWLEKISDWKYSRDYAA